MNLHRIQTLPDWSSINKKNYNRWQRVAAATNGILTPGNILTLLGLGLVLYGLWLILSGDVWFGLLSLVIGRACDLFDGWAAEATGTKSFLGELFDAAADKIATILSLVVVGSMGIISWPIFTALLLPHVVIPIIIYTKRRRGIHTHPSRIGKLSMAGLWVSMAGYITSYALGDALPASILFVIYVVTVLTICGGWYAILSYLKDPTK
jgi:phosphatidylglycerophosphate synthase